AQIRGPVPVGQLHGLDDHMGACQWIQTLPIQLVQDIQHLNDGDTTGRGWGWGDDLDSAGVSGLYGSAFHNPIIGQILFCPDSALLPYIGYPGLGYGPLIKACMPS